MPVEYELKSGVPSAKDFCRLRAVAGMTPRSEAAAEAGLPGTLHGVLALAEGRVIGMGRIVGDGGLVYHICDMAVEPGFQGRGIGRAIMAALMAHLKAEIKAEAYVNLLADGPARFLYGEFGLELTEPETRGMGMWLRP
ncbi:MAG: GNAT superfamily N-acetyltransferase [Halocynthiibacter sp.]|jgi:GNAT superfamily N-acetyltransferase